MDQAMIEIWAGPFWPGLCGVLGLLCTGLGWQLRRLRHRHVKACWGVQRLEELLLTSSDGIFCWLRDPLTGAIEQERCSRRLAVLLGLYNGSDSGFADLCDRFDQEQAIRLRAAVTALWEAGDGFEIDLSPQHEPRRLQIRGCRAADERGRVLADVLWVRDLTESVAMVDALTIDSLALQQERDALRAQWDHLPLPLWVRDRDLTVIRCNQAYARAVDAVTPVEAVQRGGELVGAALLREARALAARARAAGESRAAAFHLVMQGARRRVELLETPVPDGPDEQRLTVGLAIDRTVEEDLRDQLERHIAAHAEVLETLGTAIAIFTPDTRLSFHNTAFCLLWQLDADWLAGQPRYAEVLEVLRTQRRLPEVADFRAYREEEGRLFTSLLEQREDLLHLPDGRTLRRVCSPHPFGGLLFTYEDVTDALALERSLKTSLAVQRETLDHLYEGVAVIGSDGRLKLSNPAYGRIWDLSAEDLAGAPHMADLVERLQHFFVHASDWPLVRDTMLGLVAERAAQQGRLERSDGAVLDFTAVPLPDGAVLTTWLDATDSVQVERALRDRNDALAAADRLKSAFIANVSIEVRTPLTSILGFAEVLSHQYYGPLNSRQQDYARHIIEAGQHLTQVISDILDLAAIEAGHLTLSLNAVDVHAMLAGVLRLTRERLRTKQIILHFDCPLDIGWMVADERRIRQVLFNLLSNAVKFTPEGGQVTLACQRDGGSILFTIADTGQGIAAADQDVMFGSFVRGASRPDMTQNGAGLGLTLVRNFVEMHGGRIELHSVPNEGTTFILHLPGGMDHDEAQA